MYNRNKKVIYLSSFTILVILLIAGSFHTKLFSQKPIVDKGAPVVTAAVPATRPSLMVLSEDEAKRFFDKFVELENNFDPAILDLYTEDAVMKATRVYPDGMVREIQFTKDQFKQLAPVALPLGKQRNDKNTFSDIEYIINDDSIKITATRYNHYKKYTSDFYMVIKYVGDELKIKEVFYETIP